MGLQTLWDDYRSVPSAEARNRLVEAYQPLVREVVKRFASRLPRTVDRGDLETAANVGLIAAVECFDPTRGVRFESYCELRAKGALLDELRSQDWLPRPWRQRIERHKRVLERLRSELGAEPSDGEVADRMGVSRETYLQLFGSGVAAAAARAGAREGGEEGAGGIDVVPDRRAETAEDKLTREELLALIAQRLTVQEYRVVYLKYWEELPMREIGELTGLSESRVCKIHARLIERLRDRFRVGVGGSA